MENYKHWKMYAVKEAEWRKWDSGRIEAEHRGTVVIDRQLTMPDTVIKWLREKEPGVVRLASVVLSSSPEPEPLPHHTPGYLAYTIDSNGYMDLVSTGGMWISESPADRTAKIAKEVQTIVLALGDKLNSVSFAHSEQGYSVTAYTRPPLGFITVDNVDGVGRRVEMGPVTGKMSADDARMMAEALSKIEKGY